LLTFTRRAGTVPVNTQIKWLRSAEAKFFFHPAKAKIVKTVLNNLWTHIGYGDDGHLVHTDKRTGMQFVSVRTWPNLVAARQALDIGFSKIEWEEFKEPPPAV
jgi:hypothetical protein